MILVNCPECKTKMEQSSVIFAWVGNLPRPLPDYYYKCEKCHDRGARYCYISHRKTWYVYEGGSAGWQPAKVQPHNTFIFR
jgi:hypothetical protein